MYLSWLHITGYMRWDQGQSGEGQMKRMIWIVALIASMPLNACMSTRQQEFQQESQAILAQLDFSNDPRFAVLRGKMPLSPGEASALPTLAELSNSSRPTPIERQAIMELDKVQEPYRTALIDVQTRYAPPTVVALTKQRASAVLELKAQLADGQITYGQYRQRSYANLAATNRAIAEAQPVRTNCVSLDGSVSCVSGR
jgi:hypothetical protein